MRKRQLSAGQNLSSIQSPLTTSSIKHTLPTLLYVLCFYEFPKFKLYSASFPDFYIFLFGFPSPPPREKIHPYQTRVLLPTKTPLLPTSIQSSSSSKSWEVVSKLEVGPMWFVRTWNENREAKKQNQWKACIDIFQMIQMYGILITYMY